MRGKSSFRFVEKSDKALIEYIATCLTLVCDIWSRTFPSASNSLSSHISEYLKMHENISSSVSTALISLSYLEIILCRPSDSWQMFLLCSFKSNHGQKTRQHSWMLPIVFCRRPPQQTSLAYWWPCFLWAGLLLYIAYEKWARCQIQSCVCIYPDESSVKGKTVSMFKGHALMVTLPQTHSNRLCHSPSPVRVKGDTTWKHDAGDTFITGWGAGPVTQKENPFQYTTHITTVKLLSKQHKFAVV